MTSDFKFLSYEPTPSITNQKGIVTVLLDDKWIQRLKLVTKKDGTGSFLACANLKGEPEDGADSWRDSFDVERNSVKEQLHSFIRDKIRALTPTSSQSGVTERGRSEPPLDFDDSRVPF